MDGIRQSTNLRGVTVYTFEIGTTTFIRTKWDDVLSILRELKDKVPARDAGYGKGVYSGD